MRSCLFAANGREYVVFRNRGDIVAQDIGKGRAAEEVGGQRAAWRAEPEVSVLADGVGAGGGSELEGV